MNDFVCKIVIDSRFSGPPGLGNGGYVAGGVVARAVGSEATVTLRAPQALHRHRGLRIGRQRGGARLRGPDRPREGGPGS